MASSETACIWFFLKRFQSFCKVKFLCGKSTLIGLLKQEGKFTYSLKYVEIPLNNGGEKVEGRALLLLLMVLV